MHIGIEAQVCIAPGTVKEFPKVDGPPCFRSSPANALKSSRCAAGGRYGVWRRSGRRFARISTDIDFLVEFDSTTSLPALDRYFGLKEDLESLLGRPVDLVMPGAVTNPYLRAEIERDRRLLYAACVCGVSRERFSGISVRPPTCAQIPDAARIIAFRNILIHGYAVLDHQIVWRVIHDHLPPLVAAVDCLLKSHPPPEAK